MVGIGSVQPRPSCRRSGSLTELIRLPSGRGSAFLRACATLAF
jgi:hypothetical protein